MREQPLTARSGVLQAAKNKFQRKHSQAGRSGSSPLVRPAPVLHADRKPTSDEEGQCGNFQREIKWRLVNPRKGFIIQKITKTIDIKQVSAPTVAMSPAQVDTYVAGGVSTTNLNGEMTYWEAWSVSSTGHISYGGVDCFGLCAIIPVGSATRDTTFGTYTIRGEAAFYQTNVTLGSLGLNAQNVTAAGGLPSSTADPTGTRARASNVVTHVVTVTWDSRNPPSSPLGDYGDSTVAETIT
jgi:hypothetical protein